MDRIKELKEENEKLKKEWDEITGNGYMALEILQPFGKPSKYFILPMNRSGENGTDASKKESE